MATKMGKCCSWTYHRMSQVSYTLQYLTCRKRQLEELRRTTTSRTWSPWCRFLTAIALDLLLGGLIIWLFYQELNPDRLLKIVSYSTNMVASKLSSLILWLMEAPAGLKLNSVWSKNLGKFFLYHIHLWETYLILIAPQLFELLVVGLNKTSLLGFCFHVCVLLDIFKLATFHIYVFYTYARRVFLSQTSGLLSLWRLFRGKKYNPLRKRVDSLLHINVDQLFVGALAFTILFFLYPTSLVYFCVFKSLQSVLSLLNWVTFYSVMVMCNLAVARKQPSLNLILEK